MEKDRVLLEFEELKEARRVISSGSRELGGLQLGLEQWNPRTGCWTEEEVESEVWVKIIGLPISLWSPMILKRVGEECGGFVAVDDRTKTMGEIQWSRLLVKTRGDFRPSVLEIEVEEDVYVLSLWWEVRPVVRMKHNEASGRKSDEVRGDVISRTEQRVEKELVSARLETLNLPADVRGARENGSGRELGNRVQGPVTRDWALIDGLASWSSSLGLIVGLKEARRANGPVMANGYLGSKSKEAATDDDGSKIGPSSRRWATEMGCQRLSGFEGMERAGPIPQAPSKGSQEKVCLLDCLISRNGSSSKMEPFVAWDLEDLRKQQMNACFSMTDRALEEEALRYDSTFYSRGKRILGTSHLISLYSDWASEGESFDRSGDIEEESWGDKTTWLAVYEGPAENDNVCWDLGEANRISDKVRGTKRDSSTPENQAMGKEKEEKWEESSLAKFSQFLGFSAEGLEKEILSFLIKIRKRREKIHNKDLLEKSKFERELKRLECSVNYEGENKQKGPSQGKGNQIVVVQ